ncbi:hypothetical protein [Runella sp.]|jgi:hypothetical protein|uniref:hypothetical protein n=1 Tax=Runella sp. TaxID=1960881 RepID=UPI00301710B8
MKKTITFTLLMLATIGVFANQKTYSGFKGIAINNSIKFDYKDVTFAVNVMEANYQDAVTTHNLIEADYQSPLPSTNLTEAISFPMLLCGEGGPIYNASGTEIVGEWYTTCVENGPPFPIHYKWYEQ